MSALSAAVAKLAARNGPGGGAAASAAEVAALQAQLQEARAVNAQLQEALYAAQTGAVTMRGYLSKHTPAGPQLMGLFAQEWELRYFVLAGSVLRYYKSERDVGLSPRGAVDVQGCYVELETEGVAGGSQGGAGGPLLWGRGCRGVWRFRVVEPGGHLLLWLSTDSRASAEQWVEALDHAGLVVLPPGESAPPPADSPGAPRASGGGGGGGGARRRRRRQQQQQQRQRDWEACSTDSELPEVPGAAGHWHARAPPPSGTPPVRGTVPWGRPPSAPPPPGAALLLDAAAPAAGLARVAPAPPSPGGAPASASPPSPSDGPADTASECGGGGGGGDVAASAALRKPPRPPMSGSTPVHTATRYSFLSSDGVWAARHDGLLNLAMIILVVSNLRLILENLLKYGIRLNLVSYVASTLAARRDGGAAKERLYVLLGFPMLLGFALGALAIERLGLALLRAEDKLKAGIPKKDGKAQQRAAAALAARAALHDRLLLCLNAANTTAALALPCWAVLATEADLLPGFALTLSSICLWMKLVSYAHCHADLRAAHRQNQLRPGERAAPDADPSWAVLQFPENLTVGNMLWFLAAPTLVYQVNFPRSPRIRKRWLMRRCTELAIFFGLFFFIIQQYVTPTVENSQRALLSSDWPRLVERVLKLAIPTIYTWLCMFYCLFHLHLNVLGELTRFGDREFYKDFWNASTVGEYWRTWNMPVHKFLLRTIFFPAMRMGISRYWSTVLVFFVSALFHELAVGVPLHMVRFWAFAGIMLQVPLISVTEALKRRVKSAALGNTIFWISFCVVGQPAAVMMYYHDYVIRHHARAAAAAGAAAAAAAPVLAAAAANATLPLGA
ncbi:MAG: MBOAT, membrane-bound O-acyltransferase family-domain-containing protein [Monoraphidium minutum]|nr:MAG: MBOAT, membrane-bound O-acyltransferase family-domain-containing protein [Monoraphidium minutum]